MLPLHEQEEREAIHLLILPRSREAFIAFVRAISGFIARIVTGAERGSAKKFRFWDARPFTRVVEWGRDFRRVCDYLTQNILEALGFIKYRPRKDTVASQPQGQGPPG